jgi:signal transduction histidine kinase
VTDTELDRVPEELLAALSHELRTPIAVIAGYAEILGSRSDEKTRLEAAARISEAAQRLSETVERLLANARGA